MARTQDQKRIRELEKKLKDTEMERDILKKKPWPSSAGHRNKYKFIENNRSAFPVKKMCHVLDVSPSGYFRWRKVPLPSQKIKNEVLKARTRELFFST